VQHRQYSRRVAPTKAAGRSHRRLTAFPTEPANVADFQLEQRDRRLGQHDSGETILQVLVRDNNVDQALRVLKRKMQREGVFREMKRRRFYEKPSERLAREKGEGIRRMRKLKRKQAQREGLLPAPKKKELDAKKAARPRPLTMQR
jgi:small subunit ribosomal protein S21